MANTVNQPDGSSASPLNPPAPAAASTSSWAERYVVDWTAEDAWDWDDDPDPHDIQDAAWAHSFDANGSQCEIVEGAGLKISPDASTASYWSTSGQDCPSLYAKMTDWSGNIGIFDNVTDLQGLAVQCLIAGNVSQNSNGYGLALTGAGGFGITIERAYSSSVWASGSESGYRVTSSGGGVSLNSLNSAEDGTVYELFEIVMFPGGLCVASIRNETEFVEPLGSFVFQKQLACNTYVGNTASSNAWLPGEVYIQFISYNGATNTHTATFKNLRVLSLGV